MHFSIHLHEPLEFTVHVPRLNHCQPTKTKYEIQGARETAMYAYFCYVENKTMILIWQIRDQPEFTKQAQRCQGYNMKND